MVAKPLAHSFTLFAVLLALTGVGSIGAAAPAAIKPARTWSEHLSELRGHAVKVGVQVNDLPSGRLIWENSAKIPLVPASLAKVLTSYAALRALGPYYQFKTEIYACGRISGGTLEGRLVIRGGGDPYLFARDFWEIAGRLKTAGIDKVTEGVYIDNRFFQPQWEHLCIDQHCERGYNPVISALALDYNTLEFRLVSGTAVGRPARISWFPPGDYARISNRTTTIGASKPTQLQILSKGVQPEGRELFELGGPFRTELPLGAEYRINVADPVLFAARSIAEIMRRAGIEVGPGAGAARVDPKAERLFVRQSPPLGDLLFGLNRYSNNFMAETLFRVIGAEQLGTPATAAKGAQAVTRQLQQLGAGNAELAIDSGSGLSRTTRASARTFNLVLVDLYNDFEVGPEFLSSLARNGEDGTLRKRFRASTGDVTVRGKTGTLADVVGFSGYVSDGSGRVFAVTVLLNDVNQRWEARRALDNLLMSIPDLARS